MLGSKSIEETIAELKEAQKRADRTMRHASRNHDTMDQAEEGVRKQRRKHKKRARMEEERVEEEHVEEDIVQKYKGSIWSLVKRAEAEGQDSLQSPHDVFVTMLKKRDLIPILETLDLHIKDSIGIERDIQAYTDGKRVCHFDIGAFTSEEAVLLVVRMRLTIKQVDEFIESLVRYRNRKTDMYKGMKVYGAIAYIDATQSSDKYAQDKGLFTIHAQKYGTVVITPMRFRPREF